MFQANCFNVMIVSPSDLNNERKIVREALYHWNEINSRHRNIVFSILGYDSNAHTDSGAHPQEILNHQLLEQADLIIAIFWTKLGTPTTEYSSGSVEEITKHIQQGKKAHIYFSNKTIDPRKLDTEQYEKLQNYKKSIQGSTFYKEFSSEDEFEKMMGDEIQLIANELESEELIIQSQPAQTKVQFSEMEIEVLSAMKRTTELSFVKLHGGTNVNGALIKDVRTILEIEEAIESLESKDLIRPASPKREIFRLTASGLRVCDQIKG